VSFCPTSIAIFISGVTHLVYPGAVHSRFEHSLGVYHIAGEAVNEIKKYQVWHFHSILHSCVHQSEFLKKNNKIKDRRVRLCRVQSLRLLTMTYKQWS